MKTRSKIFALVVLGAFFIPTAFGVSYLFSNVSSEDFVNETIPKEESDKIIINNVSDLNVQCQGNELCLIEKVVKIIDGDTIYLDGGYKIRLSLTNTPERHELGFYEASQFTVDMCPVGTSVIVDQDDKQPYDVYDRILGKVTCGDKVLNSELLYAGHANILTRYCHTSEFSGEIWAREFGC
jgi:endonuclease YncB( thermonuclease family)